MPLPHADWITALHLLSAIDCCAASLCGCLDRLDPGLERLGNGQPVRACAFECADGSTLASSQRTGRCQQHFASECTFRALHVPEGCPSLLIFFSLTPLGEFGVDSR